MKTKKLKPYRPRMKVKPPKAIAHAKMYDRKKDKKIKKKEINNE